MLHPGPYYTNNIKPPQLCYEGFIHTFVDLSWLIKNNGEPTVPDLGESFKHLLTKTIHILVDFLRHNWVIQWDFVIFFWC